MYFARRSVMLLWISPLILVPLFLINWMTFSGVWWVKWPAIVIGFAWIINLRILAVVGRTSGVSTPLTVNARPDEDAVRVAGGSGILGSAVLAGRLARRSIESMPSNERG